jgi:hypothetical protein
VFCRLTQQGPTTLDNRGVSPHFTKENLMNQRNDKLIEDRYSSHPLLADLKAVLETAESFSSKATIIRIDNHLSVEGRAARTAKLVKSTLRDLHDLAAPVDSKRAELATLVARIKPTSFEPTDVAAALLRSEARAAVRNMSLSERAAVLTGEKADPMFIDSVLEAPAILSGLDPHLYGQVMEGRLETLFASEAAEADVLSTEIAEADAILELAKQDVASASGLNEHEFAALEKDVASRKDAVWLRREKDFHGNEVVVVVPIKGGSARPATEAERKGGAYFSSLAEYNAARAA